MKRILIIICSSVFLLALAGCLSSPRQGFVFTATHHHVTDQSTGAHLTSASIEKNGESCAYGSWLFGAGAIFYGGGGASVEKSMKKSGITKVAVVDRNSLNILGPLFFRECIEVWGE